MQAPDDLYSLLGGATSGIEAPIGDRKIPCANPRCQPRRRHLFALSSPRGAPPSPPRPLSLSLCLSVSRRRLGVAGPALTHCSAQGAHDGHHDHGGRVRRAQPTALARVSPAAANSHIVRLAICFVQGGVVVAADSRTSTGSYIANRTSDKLTPVAERIYTCRSGSAADTQAISDYVRLYLSHYTSDTGKEPSVKVAAHLFKSMCYSNKDRLTAGIICGGAYARAGAGLLLAGLAGCWLAGWL